MFTPPSRCIQVASPRQLRNSLFRYAYGSSGTTESGFRRVPLAESTPKRPTFIYSGRHPWQIFLVRFRSGFPLGIDAPLEGSQRSWTMPSAWSALA